MGVITGTKSYHKGVLRERGHAQGFTLQPKFTYWESLTPEPLLTQLLTKNGCMLVYKDLQQ